MLGLAVRGPLAFMSEPDQSSREALKRFDTRLEAVQSERKAAKAAAGSVQRGVGDGYRLVGEVLGGVLGGLGLGWTLDHFAHTTPWGVVAGLLIGSAVSAYAAIGAAGRMSDKVRARDGTAPSVPDDEDDD